MKKERKASTSLQQDYLPLYFRGDNQLFNYMQLRFQATLNLQKQHIISFPLKTFNIEKQGFIQPLAQIQTFDEMNRQAMLKNKALIKEGIFYVYFPSNIRVDEKIFKIYDKNYESFIKDVPKNFKLNFAKFIIWEEGTGEQNINFQKQKLQQLLSNCVKMTIQKKLQEFTKQIATLQALQLNQRVLRSLFVGRNKLASIYRQLKLTSNTCEHFSNLFNDILYNFKKFLAPSSSKDIQAEKTLYKSPFIVKDINKIFTYFDSRGNLLHITNFCFLKMFQAHLDLLQHYEAMKKFKQYLDFVLTNIINQIACRQDDIARNIWLIDTIDEGFKVLKQKPSQSIMNSQKQEQYSLMCVSICSQYRNAIERIGVIFYGLNTYIVFPRNLQYELTLCIKSMKNQPLTEKQYPQMKVLNRHQQVNKVLFLSGDPISQTIQAILNNFETYKLVYVRTLQLMEKTLSQSPYKKVSWSMKLSVLKATIIYFTLKDEKRMSISSLLQENKNFSYQAKKSVWQKLEIINKVYQLTLCKRYNIKMRVQDLLNIILDDSIIHLQNIWIQLVDIVSKLLFEYKKGESQEEAEKLNTIDYGEGQGDEDEGLVNRKRRRTTIHYDTKQIQVGTMKFISLVDSIESDSPILPNNKQPFYEINNDSIRLNIELSNRIISYALALIQKSKVQRSQSQLNNSKSLIYLKFVIKTTNGQEKVIPFQIIQTEDKFIQVEIKSKDVMIFTIEKLLIDITDSIILLYTMPINHEKIEFYDKKGKDPEQQEDYYVNISPELKINTLQLFEPFKVEKAITSDLKYRKESTSSISSRPNSQSSASGGNYVVFQKLWTPFKFMFSFNPNDTVQIQKIQIQCQDQICDKIFVGEKEINFRQISSYKVSSQDEHNQFPLIIFVKPSQRSQTNKQQSNYLSATKRHKQSINILPKSLRNRAQSFSRSMASGPSNMSIDSNRVSIKIHLKHNSYTYQVKKQISYSKKVPFKVDYRYSQEFEEYTIKNLTEEQLQIVSEEDTFELYPYEELKVFSPAVKICLKYHEEDFQSESDEQESVNLMRILKLDEKVDLKTMIKKEHLKPQKIFTIWLDLEEKFKDGQKQVYPVFEPLRIRAEQSGYISILKWNSSQYELVGKVQGIIQYTHEENNQFLELFLIPTKKGSISLPQISINSKKGVWKNGKRIKVG